MKHGPLPSHLIDPAIPLTIAATGSYNNQKNQYPRTYTLATSAYKNAHEKFSINNYPGISSRKLCSDQKSFFAHLKPKSLIISTSRVSILQISQALTSYMTDQLKHETELEEELALGKISALELEIRNTEWEDEEWLKIRKKLPSKVKHALVKYHALMLIMRCYEKILSSVVDQKLMDKLTKDSFRSAIRKTKRIESGEQRPEGYTRQMFQTCLYANCVSFLADYTVQQAILAFGYYMYVRKERNLNRLKRDEDHLTLFSTSVSTSVDDDLFLDPSSDTMLEEDDDSGGDDDEFESKTVTEKEENKSERGKGKGKGRELSSFDPDQVGGLILSFMNKSTQLMVARALGLFMASVGGAFGSVLKPGWGTLFGTQLGDACVGALLDD